MRLLGIWWERYMYHLPRKKQSNQKLQGRKMLYKKSVAPYESEIQHDFEQCVQLQKRKSIYLHIRNILGWTRDGGTAHCWKCKKQWEWASWGSEHAPTFLESLLCQQSFKAGFLFNCKMAACVNRASYFLFLTEEGKRRVESHNHWGWSSLDHSWANPQDQDSMCWLVFVWIICRKQKMLGWGQFYPNHRLLCHEGEAEWICGTHATRPTTFIAFVNFVKRFDFSFNLPSGFRTALLKYSSY